MRLTQKRRPGSRRGVTLVEIMVATAILSVVAGMIWVSFDQGSRAINAVEASQDRYHEAHVALSIISRDLASAFLSKHVNMEHPAAEYLFVGEDRSPIDRLDFVTFSHTRRTRDVHESDQAEIGYYGAPDQTDARVMNLIRRVDTIIDDEPLRGGKRLILARNVVGFELSYYDRQQDQWVEVWDTTQATSGYPDQLPDQVRILLTLKDERGEDLAFATQTPIHLHKALLFGRKAM